MTTIFDIEGGILLEVPITEECEHVEELMSSDYVQLSWNSADNTMIQAGAYVEVEDHRGGKFRYALLEPYEPKQKDEAEWQYQPQFQSEVMLWKKTPFFLYTKQGDKTTLKEPDWELTDNAVNFMGCVVDAINTELGITDTDKQWKAQVDASLTKSLYVKFSNTDVFSGLNAIAGAFETEWRADRGERTIYLGWASHGEAVGLEVGSNVNVPSKTDNKEDYFTRFFVYGSTRNIMSAASGAVNSIVNRRLTLDPTMYPEGCIDIKRHYEAGDGGYINIENENNGGLDIIGGAHHVSDLNGNEIFATSLYFDDVYPRATEDGKNGLTISSVTSYAKYRVDENGNRIRIGTKDGQPVYDTYNVWFFKIPNLTFVPSELIIPGTSLSGSFETGNLQSWEFELAYHDTAVVRDTAGGGKFSLEAGYFEIMFKEENDLIIPTVAGSGLTPKDGDYIALYNINMPDSYVADARKELRDKAIKAIEDRSQNLNNYSFYSNPIAFEAANPKLAIGSKVTYINGSYSYETRVIRLVTKLDFPCVQNITIGNKKIQGTISELKEEVVSANKNIELLSAYSDAAQSYARLTQTIKERFDQISKLFIVHNTDNTQGYDPSKTIASIESKYGLWSSKFISAKGEDDTANAGGLDIARMWEELAAKATGDNQIIDDSHIPSSIARDSNLLRWRNVKE